MSDIKTAIMRMRVVHGISRPEVGSTKCTDALSRSPELLVLLIKNLSPIWSF